MDHDSLERRAERFRAIAWSRAADWSPTAGEWILEYYEKMLPFWPEATRRPSPTHDAFLSAFLDRLTAEERDDVEQTCEEIVRRAQGRPTWMTRRLMRLALACGALCERHGLDVEDDPSLPMLRLFEEGYELNPTHGGFDVLYSKGMVTMPLPSRDAIERRACARRDGQAKSP